MIYEDIMRELESRRCYKAEVYAPYYVCSHAVHVFNLMNRKREVYWEGKRLPNMRLHIVFVAPPGFMKSYYLGVMGGDSYGIFKECGTNIGFEQSMCLPAGQQVQMADGSNRSIEDIVVGDKVLSWDNKIVPTTVTNTLKLYSSRILKVTLEDGRAIQLTPEHPLLTFPIEWKQAGEIRCGEYVAVPRRYAGSEGLCTIGDPSIAWMKVVSTEVLPGDVVYNISTSTHTFIAQNIITHNSEAGFIGTVVNMNGVGFPEYGAAYQYKEGVLLVDEFSAITDAMHAQYNAQLSTQLLAALDHGNVHKRLANGKIAYETSLTLWAGVQPARYDLSSGLGRRLFFLLFLPTRDDNEALMRTMHETRNLRPNKPAMEGLWRKIDTFRQNMDVIQKVEYSSDVLDIYFRLGLYSYESSYFDRLMLGYQLAVYGPEKHVTIDTKDQQLVDLVSREKLWRDEIAKGVDYTQVLRIIEELGGKVTKKVLVEEAIMVGWNAEQVYSTLADMSKYGIVRFQGPYVELIK